VVSCGLRHRATNQIANMPMPSNATRNKPLRTSTVNIHHTGEDCSTSSLSRTMSAPNAQSSGTSCTLFVNFTLHNQNQTLVTCQSQLKTRTGRKEEEVQAWCFYLSSAMPIPKLSCNSATMYAVEKQYLMSSFSSAPLCSSWICVQSWPQ